MPDLKQLCLECVRERAAAERWLLPSFAFDRLAEAILPYVEQLQRPDHDAVCSIVTHYRQDGPMVQAMVDALSAQGGQLWQEWRVYFMRLAAARGVLGEEAEELAQVTCERALKGLAGFGFRSSLKTWLTTVFVHCHLEKLRNRQTQKRGGAGTGGEEYKRAVRVVSLDQEDPDGVLLSEGVMDPDLPPEQRHVQNECRQLLEDELDRLLKNEDVLILRRYYVEQEYRDAATGEMVRWTDEALGRDLGLPRNTVTSRRQRALERLKRDPAIRRLAFDMLGLDL